MTREEIMQLNTDYLNGCESEHKMNELFSYVLEQQPCDDVISRDMALEKMADYVASGYADSAEDYEEYSRIICQLPPVTPQQKYGKWIDEGWYAEGHSEHAYRCSECNEHYIGYVGEHKFCPNCGCRMVEPQESEEE